jgi:hypothetical protein
LLHVPKRCNWRYVESRERLKPRRMISWLSDLRVHRHGCGSCWQCSSWLIDVLNPSLRCSLYRRKICFFFLSRYSWCVPFLDSFSFSATLFQFRGVDQTLGAVDYSPAMSQYSRDGAKVFQMFQDRSSHSHQMYACLRDQRAQA